MKNYQLPDDLTINIKQYLSNTIHKLYCNLIDLKGYYQFHKEDHPDWVVDCPKQIENLIFDIKRHEEWLDIFNK